KKSPGKYFLDQRSQPGRAGSGQTGYVKFFCPAGRRKKSPGASSPAHGSGLPEPGKGHPFFQGRDGVYHPGPESRKISRGNCPYGSDHSDDEDVFLISAGLSSKIHCRSSTRALTTACSLTLLRSPSGYLPCSQSCILKTFLFFTI